MTTKTLDDISTVQERNDTAFEAAKAAQEIIAELKMMGEEKELLRLLGYSAIISLYTEMLANDKDEPMMADLFKDMANRTFCMIREASGESNGK